MSWRPELSEYNGKKVKMLSQNDHIDGKAGDEMIMMKLNARYRKICKAAVEMVRCDGGGGALIISILQNIFIINGKIM